MVLGCAPGVESLDPMMKQRKLESSNSARAAVSKIASVGKGAIERFRRGSIADFGYVPDVEKIDHTMNQRPVESSSVARHVVSDVNDIKRRERRL